MKQPIADIVYPERRVLGFTRLDGTVHFASRVRALLGETDTVLDVGCGRGQRVDDACEYRRGLQDFRGPRRRVIGIDVDPDAETNPYLDEFRLIEDPCRWPVEDGAVDLLYCDYVLEHVEDPASFFGEASRVLAPGGRLALRTPNSRSYIALLSRLIPNRHHAKVAGYAQGTRKAMDVFPTVYRCNTRGRLRRALRKAGFEAAVYAIEAEPGYMSFSRLAYRVAAGIHAVLPPGLRTTLLAFGRKPGPAEPA